MRQPLPRKHASETEEAEKVPVFVAKGIREAILDEVFQPGDRLAEADLAEKFQVSLSPVREALLALEKEGTVITSPYKGAMVKPLSLPATGLGRHLAAFRQVDSYIVISTYVRLGSSAKMTISSSSVMESGWTVATRME